MNISPKKWQTSAWQRGSKCQHWWNAVDPMVKLHKYLKLSVLSSRFHCSTKYQRLLLTKDTWILTNMESKWFCNKTNLVAPSNGYVRSKSDYKHFSSLFVCWNICHTKQIHCTAISMELHSKHTLIFQTKQLTFGVNIRLCAGKELKTFYCEYYPLFIITDP